MKGVIEHKGVVISSMEQVVDVEIETHGACVSCKIRGACEMGDTKDKIVSVATKYASYFKPGDRVIVSVGQAMGMKAVALAYMAPFFIMIAVLVGLSYAGFSELVMGVSALCAVAVYYWFLYLSRHKLEREIFFSVRMDVPGSDIDFGLD